MLAAIRHVIGRKMATGELQFRDLGEGNLAAVIPEIIAVSGLPSEGVRIDSLSMLFGIDGHPPYRPAAPKPQPQPGPAMPNVRAQVRIGGVKINASTTDGIDTAAVGKAVVNEVKSRILWWVGFAAFGFLLIVGLGLYIWRVAASGAPGLAATASWDGKMPLVCGGNQSLTVTGVTASSTGTTVTALANCSLTLVNVDLTGATAIQAGGNAVVRVQGGKVSGSAFAVQAIGASKVTLAGTKVTGKKEALGAATITGP